MIQRNAHDIHNLLKAAEIYGLIPSALRVFEVDRGGEYHDSAATSVTAKAWARVLAPYTDTELRDGLERLARSGVEYLDLPRLAAACARATPTANARRRLQQFAASVPDCEIDKAIALLEELTSKAAS